MLFHEAAFVENVQQIYAASSPSSALSGDKIKKLIVSTPSAKFGFYWDKLNENNGRYDIEDVAFQVAEGKLYKEIPGIYWFVDSAGCCKLIIHFLAHPVYSKIPNYLDYRLQQDGTDEETVQREYNLRFIDSTVAVFDSDLVRRNAVGSLENSVDKGARYFGGLDTSTYGSDYTAFVVLKFKNNKYSLVALYKKRQQTSDYHIYQISNLINLYKPEKIGIETTGGVGSLYLEQLSKSHKDTKFEAIPTTNDTKHLMISSVLLALGRGVLSYPDNSPLIEEMLNFRRKGIRLESAPGKHDDSLMSLSFALAVAPFNSQTQSTFEGLLFE